MNGELLMILESIARDRGIDKEILIKAVEESLVSAARKSSEAIAKKKHILVQIDRKTGDIKAFAKLTIVEDSLPAGADEMKLSAAKKIDPYVSPGDTIDVDITPKNLGRIAAQSTKQIIVQKIREAERGIIYTEFKDRVGDITMGTVRHREKGNIIVDLGRTEAILPLKEQCPEERYQMGNRIRAYISEVTHSQKGYDIVLSRAHTGLVRRLFELEVPEIADGTVIIKKIVREPGYRCKVAVCSSDPKVDAIGACVGMRGSRIKNVVRELGSEKLDILKWDEDISVFVKNALSPAKIEKVIVNEKERRIEARVGDDQLSIAIGKRGQNVRLAGKLIGWDIDIRSSAEEEYPKEEAPQEAAAEKGQKNVRDIPGMDGHKAEVLINAGFDTVEKIVTADITELTALKEFGEKEVAELKEKVFKIVTGGG